MSKRQMYEMYESRCVRCVGFLAIVLFMAVPVAMDGETVTSSRWKGPDDDALPFVTDEEVLDFLANAEVIKWKEITWSKNRPRKVTLEKDGIGANAIFRTVDDAKPFTNIDGKNYRNFHDSYRYECAAYELSRLLDLDTVPPCVPRNLFDQEGSVQLWIENAKTFKERAEEDSELIKNLQWARQRQTMRIFDALIYNFDRNTGNMLIDATGKLWFIDHTRSFLPSGRIENMDKINWCDRGVWEKLKALDKDTLSAKLQPYLDYLRLLSVLQRRDKLVDYIESLIEQKGEEAVLFDRNVTVMAPEPDGNP
jgi:hypothetical protein